MYSFEVTYRVPYVDTDNMGVVYYGNYARYYEIGRTELIRSLNYTYKSMEQDGIAMPVVNMNIEYKKPALYDDILTIKTTIKQLPLMKITFSYEIFSQDKILINIGKTQLAFLHMKTNKPVKAPDSLLEALKGKL